MTVDGVIDVGDWFVAVGDHDDAARSLFETDDAAMLVGRKSFEGFAAYLAVGDGAMGRCPEPDTEVRRNPERARPARLERDRHRGRRHRGCPRT
jgi:hypothetical protein